MKRREANEKVKEIITQVIEETQQELEIEFKTARSLMDIAESELVNTLDEEQRKIYDKFCEKRKEFYKIAKEIYVK